MAEVDVVVAAEDRDPLEAGHRLAVRKPDLQGLFFKLAQDRNVPVAELEVALDGLQPGHDGNGVIGVGLVDRLAVSDHQERVRAFAVVAKAA